MVFHHFIPESGETVVLRDQRRTSEVISYYLFCGWSSSRFDELTSFSLLRLGSLFQTVTDLDSYKGLFQSLRDEWERTSTSRSSVDLYPLGPLIFPVCDLMDLYDSPRVEDSVTFRGG